MPTPHGGATFSLHQKLRARECVAARPGAHVHRIRSFYESVFPNTTVDAVAFPDDVYVKRFTDDGECP
jgi:hypothetical protein